MLFIFAFSCILLCESTTGKPRENLVRNTYVLNKTEKQYVPLVSKASISLDNEYIYTIIIYIYTKIEREGERERELWPGPGPNMVQGRP